MRSVKTKGYKFTNKREILTEEPEENKSVESRLEWPRSYRNSYRKEVTMCWSVWSRHFKVLETSWKNTGMQETFIAPLKVKGMNKIVVTTKGIYVRELGKQYSTVQWWLSHLQYWFTEWLRLCKWYMWSWEVLWRILRRESGNKKKRMTKLVGKVR